MKKLLFCLFFVMMTTTVIGQNGKSIVELDSTTIEFNESLKSDTIIGDFDGDGIKEKAWIVPPFVLCWDDQKCDGPNTTYIRFSNPEISSIIIDNCIGGKIQLLGDLNEDGAEEIGLGFAANERFSATNILLVRTMLKEP